MAQPPLVVFGTGGSGTRVVARILKEAGCFIGTNLNRALDNLDFGFLLAGRVDWMVNYFPFPGEVADKYLALFGKVFFQQQLNLSEYMVLIGIAREYLAGRSRRSFRQRPFHERFRRGMQLLQSAFFSSSHRLDGFQQWGFKSPEAIYLVEPILRSFPGAKLIHVVRDGRDMALSTRRNPLLYLAIFAIEEKDPVRAALANWCSVNAWARERCQELIPSEQYLLIRYEDMCHQPRRSVDHILSFAGLKALNMASLYEIPKPNPTIHRWKQNREHFHGLDTSILKTFGYPA